ncbi:MAG: tetratricopeptide repeat protein [Bacteroidetes bacterium]|nr:tetratricopeptide repeat protein [Bacteroidota bacterium]
MKRLTIQNFFFVVFIWCFCAVSFAGERDSLVAVLRSSKEDTNLVAQYYATGWQFEYDLPDSAMYFYNTGLALSKKLNFKKGEIRYYFNATAVYNIKSDYKTSLKLNKESVVMATDYGDKRLIAASLGNVGSTYSIMGRYDSAVFYFLQASKCMEQLRDSSGMAVLYTNMCGTYNSLRQYEKALAFGKKAIAFFERGIKSFDYVGAMNNIGVSNSRLGNHEKAIEFFKRAYIEAKKTNNTIGICVNLGNLSQEYLDTKQYEKLKATAKELLLTAKEVDLTDQLSNAYHVNAISYLYEKNYDAALECESKAVELAQKDSADDQLRRSYNTLSNIWVAKGDIEKGDSISGLSTFYFDKLLNEKTIENTSVYEAKYETEKERNKNLLQEHELKQKKIWLGVLVGVIAFIISISALFYYLQRQRQRRIETENILKEEKIQSLEREKKLEAS